MAKFVPSQHVETLEYDFTQYGGSEGVIPEPTTGKVNGFFKATKDMVKEVNALRGVIEDVEVENMSDEDMIARMAKIDEAEEASSEFQKRTIENLAILCGAERQYNADHEERGLPEYNVVGGSPSFQDFEKLPFRVLQAFSQWLMNEIRPKRTTPGTKR
jgi:hypothetical protein